MFGKYIIVSYLCNCSLGKEVGQIGSGLIFFFYLKEVGQMGSVLIFSGSGSPQLVKFTKGGQMLIISEAFNLSK